MSNKDTFIKKRKIWLKCLGGKDKHSIKCQIWDMTWNAVSYRVICEARSLADDAPEGGVQLNGMLHDLLDEGFLAKQTLAVRRIVDVNSLDGVRGVYSLMSLLKDMQDNSSLFTRENIFDAEGLAYDYGDIQRREDKYFSDQIKSGNACYMIPPELDWHINKERHQTIDELSGTSSSERQPNDPIKNKIFEDLKDKLNKATEDIKGYVDKYVAHPATPESREVNRDGNTIITGISFDSLFSAQIEIYHVMDFVSIYILGDSDYGTLAVPQYDQFKYIDKPLVVTEDITKLRELWENYDRKLTERKSWTIVDYKNEFGNPGNS